MQLFGPFCIIFDRIFVQNAEKLLFIHTAKDFALLAKGYCSKYKDRSGRFL